jgi:hypothetical protein
MKRQTWQAAAFLVVLLAAAAAAGQNNPTILKANIRFPFVVGNKVLPAGHYVFSSLGERTIRIADSHEQGALVLTSMVDGHAPESSGRLVFHHSQNSYFLTQVWSPGVRQGKQVFKSPAEKESERRSANEEITVLRAEN